MAVDKVTGISYASISKVIGIAKAAISKITGQTAAAGGSGGDITVSFYSGDFDIKEDTDNTAITSLTAGDDLSDDPRFYIQYGTGPTTLNKIDSESESSTLAIGAGNSRTYMGIRFTADAGGTSGAITPSGGVQLAIAAVGTSCDYHVEIWTDDGNFPNTSPVAQTGGDSDTRTISAPGDAHQFTWSSNTPSITAGTKYWIVFVDES
jgi:hypothetical protein